MADDLTGIGKLGESLEKGTKEIRQLSYDFLAPPLKEAGNLIADKIRFLRFRSGIVPMRRAKEMLNCLGLKPHPVDLKTLIPLLENCSLEEDSDMIEKWSGLLASASAGQESVVSYVHILSELSPLAAKVLDDINRLSSPVKDITEIQYYGVFVKELREKTGLDTLIFLPIIGNLNRLGLIQRIEAGIPLQEAPLGTFEHHRIGITPLGSSFLKACYGPGREAEVKEPKRI